MKLYIRYKNKNEYFYSKSRVLFIFRRRKDYYLEKKEIIINYKYTFKKFEYYTSYDKRKGSSIKLGWVLSGSYSK